MDEVNVDPALGPVEEAPAEVESEEAEEEEAEESISLSIISRSFAPSGVEKRLRDFWQNRRAEGRLRAFRCF